MMAAQNTVGVAMSFEMLKIQQIRETLLSQDILNNTVCNNYIFMQILTYSRHSTMSWLYKYLIS